MRNYRVALAGVLLLASGFAGEQGSAETFPAQGEIRATYDVGLAAFNLGELELKARFKGPSYQMRGEGHFSLFLGRVHKSGGAAASTGKIRSSGPESASFTVAYEGDGKKEERRISFNGGDVTDVKIVPKKKPGPRRVPVTEEQLEDVIDPLSAAFLHMQSGNSVCNATIPVYDGKLRYDLMLAPKRVEALPAKAPDGLSRSVEVCQVKFRPVSGHKPDNPVISYLSKTDRMEAWLVRLPGTDLYVPYWIGVPTVLGSASVTLTEIDVNAD